VASIDDVLGKRPPPSVVGLDAERWVAALRALADSPLVTDKRVLSCRVREPGNLLLVQTGEIRGPCYGWGEWVLLELRAEGWVVAEVSWWRS
jgi:hypothetical protein